MKHVSQQLERERERLIAEIEELRQGDPANNQFRDVGNNEDDDSDENERHARIQARIETNQSNLERMNRAIQKVENGTYGKCERCGKPIPQERLEFMPWAIYDIECEEIIESGRR